MNRNTESHFAELPSVEVQRSRFDRSFGHTTSFNVGELIPFYWDEVLPGDTFDVSTSCVVRLQTLLTPVMSNMYLDTYYYFVPARLVWNHWKEFMGENTESAWIPATEYSIPKVTYPENGFATGTIADYLGIPVGVAPTEDADLPMALPFRSYALCCQEWYRDQNVTDPLNIPLGDANQTGSNGSNYITDVVNGGKPFKVAKYHDYFTSALPSPQKGPAVTLPSFTGNLPVVSGSDHDDVIGSVVPRFVKTGSSQPISVAYTNILGKKDGADDADGFHAFLYGVQSTTGGTNVGDLYFSNLWANVENGLQMPTINELRLAFQLQKFYEKNARGGTRYREIIKEHFGVTSPDARMMIPEYLGGHRFPLAIHQVTNTSQSDGADLGDLGAMSNTSDINDDFIKSFSEAGFIIGVCCARYDHVYSQGLEKAWSRSKITDYYWPVFANIGEQPVFKRELYLDDAEGNKNDEVFGYQEAWAEYRYKPSRVSGEMRPGIQNSLASWHLGDYYTQAPSLSDEWIREDKTNVDRVLAVGSDVSNQILADFWIKNVCTRPMPMYSIPGLIDHH